MGHRAPLAVEIVMDEIVKRVQSVLGPGGLAALLEELPFEPFARSEEEHVWGTPQYAKLKAN